MAAATFDRLPDSLLIDILSRSSCAISQQEDNEKERSWSRVLALTFHGIFTRVSRRWRLASLSICTSLHVIVKSRTSAKQLSSWLRRNGSQFQHLTLSFTGEAAAVFPLIDIPTSTPQLQSLKLSGIANIDKPMTVEEAAAWGALTTLTSLEVDDLQYFAAPITYVQNIVELSITRRLPNMVEIFQSELPQLRKLTLPDLSLPYSCMERTSLDIFSSKQQLQQVERVTIDAADLDHPAVAKCHQSMKIDASRTDGMQQVDRWLQEGGGKQLANLVLEGDYGTSCADVLARLQGLPLLRELDLMWMDLGRAAAQQLRQLTQITELRLSWCTPRPVVLEQLPAHLRKLYLEAPVAPLQQPQDRVSTLQHLTSLTLCGSTVTDASLQSISSLMQLREIDLIRTPQLTPSGGLVWLGQLQSLTSLTVSNLSFSAASTTDLSVLSSLSKLERLLLCSAVPLAHALAIAKYLSQAPVVMRVDVEVPGKALQVVVAEPVEVGKFTQHRMLLSNETRS